MKMTAEGVIANGWPLVPVQVPFLTASTNGPKRGIACG
jgi:hypothetical protein